MSRKRKAMPLRDIFRRRCWLMVAVLMLIGALAACGTNTSSVPSAGSSQQHASPGSTPTTTGGSGTETGCPSKASVTTPPPPADVLVKPSAGAQPYIAHVGNIVEVDLPFGNVWTGPISPTGGLQLQMPAGYASGTVCVWRFVAQSTGTVQLAFSGHAMCKHNIPCLLSEIYEAFTVVTR